MIKIFLPLIGIACATSSLAQQPTINWGEESKTELTFNSFVNGTNNEMIKLCFEGKATGMWGQKKAVTPVLARYSDKLAELSVRSYQVDDKNISFNNLLSVKGKLYLFTSQYDGDSKTTTFYSQALDIKTLNPVGKPVNLGSFDAINKKSQSKIDYELSKDSSHILMFGLAPASKKENEKYYIGVYDFNMQKKWENTVTLPYPDKYITVLDRLVTNEGKVGVIIKHYDQEVSREAISKDGEKVPSYNTKLLLYDETKAAPAEFALNVGNKFVHTLQLTDDAGNNLQLFGLYKDKYNGYISGYFLANIDKTTKQVTTRNVNAFPEALVHQIKVDKQGSDRERDPGLNNNFKLAQVADRADGSIDYILEYQESKLVTTYSTSGNVTTSRTYWVYSYGDILDISIKKNNTNVITRIPKMQIGTDVNIYHGFKALPYKNKLVLFYNDDDDNLERAMEKKPDDLTRFNKCVFVMATIDDKGNLERSIQYGHKDVKMTTAVKECFILDRNRLGLYASKLQGIFSSARDMIGILELK